MVMQGLKAPDGHVTPSGTACVPSLPHGLWERSRDCMRSAPSSPQAQANTPQMAVAIVMLTVMSL